MIMLSHYNRVPPGCPPRREAQRAGMPDCAAMSHTPLPPARGPATACIVGGGPAGLMAAERLLAAGVAVDLYDAMPTVGRKFLLAGIGGLNLTHGEPHERFATRFGSRQPELRPLLDEFSNEAVRAWAQGLGVATFVGSSGRVFPTDMKAAPLLRAWLQRLRAAGLRLHMRRRWTGQLERDGTRWQLGFSGGPDDRPQLAQADAVVLALGGGSWARLGSDGAWWPWLQAQGVALAPLQPANCGFDVAGGWSEHFRSRHAGAPLKNVALRFDDGRGQPFEQRGECVVTANGLEGSLVYAASARLRDALAQAAPITIELNLLPQREAAFVAAEVARPRGSRSLSTHLKSRLAIDGVKAALLHECLPKALLANSAALAAALQALPIRLAAARPIDEAISSAGGVRFDALDPALMLKALPGVFCAGEMLDWEAPTGGYLLTACLASGRRAGAGAAAWLHSQAGAAPLPS